MEKQFDPISVFPADFCKWMDAEKQTLVAWMLNRETFESHDQQIEWLSKSCSISTKKIKTLIDEFEKDWIVLKLDKRYEISKTRIFLARYNVYNIYNNINNNNTPSWAFSFFEKEGVGEKTFLPETENEKTPKENFEEADAALEKIIPYWNTAYGLSIRKTENLKTEFRKAWKKYWREDIKYWMSKYEKFVKENSEWYKHRFPLLTFLKQANWLQKFINS